MALIVPLLSINLLFITYYNCPTSSPFVLAILETFICLSSVFFFVYGTKYFLSEKSILLHFLTFLIVDILIFLNSYSVYFLYCFLFNFTDIPELDVVYCMIYAWLLFSFFAFIMMIVIHNRNKAFSKEINRFLFFLFRLSSLLFSVFFFKTYMDLSFWKNSHQLEILDMQARLPPLSLLLVLWFLLFRSYLLFSLFEQKKRKREFSFL